MTRMFVPTAALLLLSACAAPSTGVSAAAPAKDCFNASQVSGFSEADGAAIRVSPSPGRTYELGLSGPQCDDVGWARTIAIDPSPSSYICVGETPSQGRVLFRDSGGPRVVRCQITSVTRAPVRTAGQGAS